MSKVVVIEAPVEEVLKKHGVVSIEEARRRTAQFRAKLRQAVQQVWSTPEGQLVKDLMSAIAHQSGYAAEVRSIMRSVAGQLREAAERTGIGLKYKSIFKPVAGGEA